MNESNLISLADRTTEEQREIARKGGIASGEVRRRKKTLKEALLIALEIEKGDKTVQQIGVEALLERFMSGDIQAFTTVRDTIGEKPKDEVEQKQEIKVVMDNKLEEWGK